MKKKTMKDRWRYFLVRVKNLIGSDSYLCDTCRFDYRSCNNPDRPNATRCPHYRSRF